MILSLNWLKKYVALQDSPANIAEALTSLGMEVENFETRGEGVSHVVSAEVLSCAPHPGADKLSLCEVTDGIEKFSVVCGAPNVAAGQKVVFAKTGAVLPGNFKIKKSNIRGVESEGMICAQDELGLGTDHSGIIVLPPETPAGTPLQDLPGLCDTSFDVSVTPNRPDALCHIGIARELAGYYRIPLQYPECEGTLPTPEPLSGGRTLKVLDPDRCPLYTARIINNVRIGPSPGWLADALRNAGQKGINNVVDLSNYVLLEFGQPSHTFDLDKLAGNRLTIRRASRSEKLIALDETELELSSDDLVIADEAGPQCLAGVMGGLHSGVTEKTANILLEVAAFKPQGIRSTSKRLNLSSESSYRFERGTDPLRISWISQYLTEQICLLTGGTAQPGLLEDRSQAHPSGPKKVALRVSRLNQVLGTGIAEKEAADLLESIELKTDALDRETLSVEIPGFRADLDREADLIEEVARLYNYNNIPSALPEFVLRKPHIPPLETISKTIRHHLAAAGLNECVSLRFNSLKDRDKLLMPEDSGDRRCVQIKNPLNPEGRTLPTSLLPNLLQSVNRNHRNQETICRFFEIGKVFFDRSEQRSEKDPGVVEEDRLALVLTGDWNDCAWEKKNSPPSFYVLKGLIENLCQSLRVPVSFAPQIHYTTHPRESLDILIGKRRIGSLGTLHPQVVENFELKLGGAVAELSLSSLMENAAATSFQAFSHFTSVTREMNIVVDKSVSHDRLLKWMSLDSTKYLESVRLNSIYKGGEIGEGKKALHYSFMYRHKERTLKDEEVNKVQEKIADRLRKREEVTFK